MPIGYPVDDDDARSKVVNPAARLSRIVDSIENAQVTIYLGSRDQKGSLFAFFLQVRTLSTAEQLLLFSVLSLLWLAPLLNPLVQDLIILLEQVVYKVRH